MRRCASASKSERLPQTTACVGQTCVHAGCDTVLPTMCRHSSHFTIFGLMVSHSNFGILNGQATWQYRQPMHSTGSQPTTPCGSLCSAFIGQPDTHAGSTQCMHCCFMNDRSCPSAAVYSLIRFFVCAFSVSGCMYSPPDPPTSGFNPLAFWHAGMHARHPMHLVASYINPTASGSSSNSLLSPALASGALVIVAAATADPPINTLSISLRLTSMAHSLPEVPVGPLFGAAASFSPIFFPATQPPARNPPRSRPPSPVATGAI